MEPGRWRQIKEALEGALERAPGERPAFLDAACAGDSELRGRVEELLASDAEMGDFLNAPAIDPSAGGEPDITGQSIGPYRILREIGRGGMGSVYLAERADGQYRKQVAIKLVRPGFGGAELLRRFRNERQVAAGLDHPNIARLLDGGATADGAPYLVMEYVEGLPIDEWCESRNLPLPDRLELFRHVCAAVQYAHEKRIVHRDIKPQNILVTAAGTPKLLDFGIAKAFDRNLAAETMHTAAGAGPMTPEFASPEQAGGGAVGPAADIYALGLILYILLTGRLPPAARGSEPPPPSAACGRRGAGRRAVAGDLDNIVLKALRREPERRYASAADLAADIERHLLHLPVRARSHSRFYRAGRFLRRNRVPAAAATAGAVLALGLAAGLARLNRPGADNVRSIAVLPLDSLSGAADQDYFADGVTDALIGELARIPDLRVISRTSVMSFPKGGRKLPEIARMLRVQTIAEGSVNRSGNRVRIAIRLIDAGGERPIWSGAYEAEIRDILALQTRVAAAIASEIHLTLTEPLRQRAARRRPVDLDAYEAYLQGRRLYRAGFSQTSLKQAIAFFERAISLDPGYAPAHAGLADCHYLLSNVYEPPREVMPKAKSAALRAIELDPELGEAHATLALVRSLYDYERTAAEAAFRRAIECKPGDAQTHLWYGIHLASLGRFAPAAAEVERARQLDPVSPGMNAYVGLPFYLARDYAEAVRILQPVIEAYPDYHHPLALAGLSFEQMGAWEKATAALERAYELDREPEALAQLGHVYAASGRAAEARKVLRQMRDLSASRFVAAYNIAILHAGLGEREQTFEWLGKAAEDRSEWFAFVAVDPRLDPYRADPRFAALARLSQGR